MATTVKIRIRRDTSANWKTNNPVLAQGEIAADMDKIRLKVGNGVSNFNDLQWVNGDIYNGLESVLQMLSGVTGGHLLDPVATVADLATTYASPTAGDMVYVKSENAFYTWDGTAWKTLTMTPGGLDAAEVNSKIDAKLSNFGVFGMGYTVDEFNAYRKPTKITFADGVTATLTWTGGTQLNKITASTGETMQMVYDGDGRIIGRTVTKTATA